MDADNFLAGLFYFDDDMQQFFNISSILEQYKFSKNRKSKDSDVSGLNDQLPLYKLQIRQESCYYPLNSIFRGWLSMKVSLEILNLEINRKTFTHVRLKSISYTPYNQHPSPIFSQTHTCYVRHFTFDICNV